MNLPKTKWERLFDALQDILCLAAFGLVMFCVHMIAERMHINGFQYFLLMLVSGFGAGFKLYHCSSLKNVTMTEEERAKYHRVM